MIEVFGIVVRGNCEERWCYCVIVGRFVVGIGLRKWKICEWNVG